MRIVIACDEAGEFEDDESVVYCRLSARESHSVQSQSVQQQQVNWKLIVS